MYGIFILIISLDILKLTSNVGKLLQLGRVDLLNLGANEEAAHADQLQPVLGHRGGEAEEAVDEVDSEVESLPVESVHLAHFYQPVKEDGAHAWLQRRVAGEQGIWSKATIHAGLLLHHQVPHLLPVGPGQLWQRSSPPHLLLKRLRYKRSEPEERGSEMGGNGRRRSNYSHFGQHRNTVQGIGVTQWWG